jgi:hypothetical protein
MATVSISRRSGGVFLAGERDKPAAENRGKSAADAARTIRQGFPMTLRVVMRS